MKVNRPSKVEAISFVDIKSGDVFRCDGEDLFIKVGNNATMNAVRLSDGEGYMFGSVQGCILIKGAFIQE